jgi:parallel beta-helix repeat protein
MERDQKMVLGKEILAFVMSMVVISLLGDLFIIQSCPAQANIIYVNDSNTEGPWWDGTQDYPYQTIQEGIAAANVGDTVSVSSGTYNENVNIDKDLSLIGKNKDATFIDGGRNGHVLNVRGPTDGEIHVHISGLTIRNAGGSGFDCVTFSYVTNGEISNNTILNSQQGEGISLDHCQDITISDNVIYNNAMAGVSLTLSEQNVISNNIIQYNQKGIHLSFSNNNEIFRNTIYENTQYGVYIVQSSSNVFSFNDFTGNLPNARDPSMNVWSSNGQGNYWDDYNKYDNNSDGIGDAPYAISGGSSQDEYPLGYFKQPEQPGGNQLPTVLSLSISPTSATFGERVSFSGEGLDTDGTIDAYYWRSNLDGKLSEEQSFSTTTLSVGVHTIYFKVLDNNGAWSTEATEMVTISSVANKAPTSVIDEISPNPAKQYETILFHGHGADSDGIIIGYKWLSNRDGVLSTQSTFSTSALSLGTHTIYFQVKDNTNDWSQQVTRTLIIEKNSSQMNPDNQAPIANAGGPYQGKVNEMITFDGSGSYDQDGTITVYQWSFGDNSTGSSVSSTHTYTTPGTYIITVQVTDDDGADATAFTSIVISQSYSQADDPENASAFAFELSFPIIIVAVFLSVLGVIAGFIVWMKKR